MILITGGLGFIGSHVARALLDVGEPCVLTQHRVARRPDFLAGELGERVFVEQLDCADQTSFLEIGKRHKITGIVHLTGAGIGALGLIENLRADIQGLLNALQAAQEWGVPRMSIASTIGVYAGVRDSVFREDLPLPMNALHPIPVFKKSAELLATLVASSSGFEIVNLRIAAIWGPLGRTESAFFALPRLVHSAVKGEEPDFSPRAPAYAEAGGDMCYVKDCGQAVALLQTAAKLNHATYNVGSGRVTKNEDVVAAIKIVIPGAKTHLPDGRNPDGPAADPYLDITRIHQDTGYEPAYDIERGIADYIGWLRAGHER